MENGKIRWSMKVTENNTHTHVDVTRQNTLIYVHSSQPTMQNSCHQLREQHFDKPLMCSPSINRHTYTTCMYVHIALMYRASFNME